jgi:hypothetical protein
MVPLFHCAYGGALPYLPAPILKVHDIRAERTWHGEARVTRGDSLAARFVCWLLRFPPEGEVPLQVTMAPDGTGESWKRRFGDHPMTTRLAPGKLAHTVEETLAPITLVSRLDADGSGVNQVPVGLRLFGIELPRILWPQITARESSEGPRYRFMISIALPWNAPLVHYEGWLDA